jgi:hypothetical protein
MGGKQEWAEGERVARILVREDLAGEVVWTWARRDDLRIHHLIQECDLCSAVVDLAMVPMVGS